MRPLYFRQACSEMLCSLPVSIRGKSSLVLLANCCTNWLSSPALRAASRSLRSALTSKSARHSPSARSSALSSTRSPCRSYRRRARLHFKTTADKRECFRARRVRAASPEARKTSWSKSPHERQSAPLSLTSVIQAFVPRSSRHSSQVELRCEMKTLISSLSGFAVVDTPTG